MNKHIELVKKWLANPESVSQEELEANVNAAEAAYVTADAAAYAAAYDDTHAANARYWVEEYEELTK